MSSISLFAYECEDVFRASLATEEKAPIIRNSRGSLSYDPA